MQNVHARTSPGSRTALGPRSSLLLVLAACFAFAGHGEVQGRPWTDRQGRRVEAEFVQLAGEQVVVLRRGTRSLRVLLSDLSDADQVWVREHVARNPAAGGAVPGGPGAGGVAAGNGAGGIPAGAPVVGPGGAVRGGPFDKGGAADGSNAAPPNNGSGMSPGVGGPAMAGGYMPGPGGNLGATRGLIRPGMMNPDANAAAASRPGMPGTLPGGNLAGGAPQDPSRGMPVTGSGPVYAPNPYRLPSAPPAMHPGAPGYGPSPTLMVGPNANSVGAAPAGVPAGALPGAPGGAAGQASGGAVANSDPNPLVYRPNPNLSPEVSPATGSNVVNPVPPANAALPSGLPISGVPNTQFSPASPYAPTGSYAASGPHASAMSGQPNGAPPDVFANGPGNYNAGSVPAGPMPAAAPLAYAPPTAEASGSPIPGQAHDISSNAPPTYSSPVPGYSPASGTYPTSSVPSGVGSTEQFGNAWGPASATHSTANSASSTAAPNSNDLLKDYRPRGAGRLLSLMFVSIASLGFWIARRFLME